MVNDQYRPYYKAFSDPGQTAVQRWQEQEWENMRACYSDFCRKAFTIVKDRCETLDYEGSVIFDEVPDVAMLRKIAEEIQKELEIPEVSIQSASNDLLEDLVLVLLAQEITRRRCRNHCCP